jgi:hypothetical protein
MSLVPPPPQNENAGVSGPFNSPQIALRRPSALVGAATWSLTGRMRRLNSSPGAFFVVARAFAGVLIGGALGAAMFSVFDSPVRWAGLAFGAALGAAYTIGERPR